MGSTRRTPSDSLISSTPCRAAHVSVTPRGGDCYVLRPSSHIGVLTTGDLSVVVRPKVPMDSVMFVLAYTSLGLGA